MNRALLMLIAPTIVVSAMAQQQQRIEVSGVVTDKSGQPLIGANVSVKDMPGLGVITDLNGRYKIKIEQYKTLVFTYVGYQKQEVLIKGDKKVINVSMAEQENNVLDEVVVTGMGAQKKLTVTGAVTNVNMDDLKHYSTSNLSNALAGNVPGIIAYQKSGQPGQTTSEFWIRGISTFGAGASALILVDGFERSNLDELNIEDIESFTVLKDASATAIYGSKGANGVVLITTKRGKEGKINVNAKFETSYNTRTKTPQFEDGLSYAKLMNEARQTRNLGLAYTPQDLELIRTGLDPDMYPNVDWSNLLLKKGAWSYRANVNLSGGGRTSRYYASIAYVEDDGMYKTDETLRKKYNTNANYKKWNYRLNVDIDITRTTVLKLGVSGDLNMRNSPGIGDEKVWGQLFGYNPLLTPVVYSNGYLPMTDLGDASRLDDYINPWVSATQTGYNQGWNNNLYSTVSLEQNLDFLTKGLRFVARFGYDTYNWNWIDHRRIPDMYKMKGRDEVTGQPIWQQIRSENNGEMKQTSGNSGTRREFLELLLNYNRTFARNHNVGFNARFTEDESIQTQNLGDDIKNSVSRKNMAFAAQATYNYKQRYFVDYNFGYNGTENFADGHRWGFFPAYSLAWNIAEEPLVKKITPWIDMFKLRYSYGKVGSDNIGTRFPYLYTIGTVGTGYNFGTKNTPRSFGGMHYTQLASTNVTWAVARKKDLGVDLVLFGNKFSLTADYFYEKRTGQYMQRNYLPHTAGFESVPWANVGIASQKGIDGNFAFMQKIGEVDLTLRGNLTYSKNEIIEADEQFNSYPYQYIKNHRVNQQRGLIALGLFKDYEDIRNSPRQDFGDVQPGDIKYKDVNGDGVVNDEDNVAIGATSTPNLIYGFGFTVKWKNFDFNMHFQGSGKSSMQINGKCVFAFRENQWGSVFKGMLDDRWISRDISGTPDTENPNASYPRLTYGANSNNEKASTFWLRDMSYFRLKNLDFGYEVPKNLLRHLHMNSVRFYVTATNLLTWSKFKYWDPEMLNPNGEVYPITKAVTIGLQVNL